jgi:hypothetical protein
VRGGSRWRASSVQAATGYKRPPARVGGIEPPPTRSDRPADDNPQPEDRRA